MRRLAPPCFLVLAVACGDCTPEPRPTACDPNPCAEANRNRCALEDGLARCLCNEGTLPRPNGTCEPVGPGNCPEHSGDSAEPDDCTAKAKPLSTGSTNREQTIEPAGDYDFFSFNGTADFVYSAKVTAAFPLLPRIDLFDQGGVLVASAERSGEVTMYAKLPATSSYYLRVSHSQSDPSVASGAYQVDIDSLGREDHGDSRGPATNVAPSSFGQNPVATVEGKFEYPGDQDWMHFTGSGSRSFRVTFDETRTVPAFSLFVGSETAPRFTTQQPITDFDVPTGDAYLVLYAPENGGNYAFNFVHSPK